MTCATCHDRGWVGVRQSGVRRFRGGWRRDFCSCAAGAALRRECEPVQVSAREIGQDLFQNVPRTEVVGETVDDLRLDR